MITTTILRCDIASAELKALREGFRPRVTPADSTEADSTTEADGAAAAHSHAAREEAARKLITNHAAVVRDVTNPAPKTQPQLTRLSEAAAPYVDQMLREVPRQPALIVHVSSPPMLALAHPNRSL